MKPLISGFGRKLPPPPPPTTEDAEARYIEATKGEEAPNINGGPNEQPLSWNAQCSTTGCYEVYFFVQASNPIGERSIRGSIHPACAVIRRISSIG